MKRYRLLLLFIVILVFAGCNLPGSVEKPTETPVPSSTPAQAPTQKPTYGPELEISGDWIIDNETVVVTPEQPIHFLQDYHEEHKIIVKNGGKLKVIDSYIRSDFRYLLELYDTSELIAEDSQLIDQHQELSGAVIINLDSSVVQATDSELDFVGIASGNRPPSYTTVNLSNCSIRQLEIDLFDIASIVVEGLGTGFIKDYTISSERFRMTLKNVNITDEIVSWTGNVEATFRNCNLGQVSPDKGSKLSIVKCMIREVVPRVTSYSGVISSLPSGAISSFQLALPATQGPTIHVVDSTIENGWAFRYWESEIEFRNCHFSALRPMGHNYTSVYDSIVNEVWLWDTSGEIHFSNSPIGWIGNIMNYPSHKNDILLSGDITVKNKDWKERLYNYHWGETVIRREFTFVLTTGSGEIVITDEEGAVAEQFVLGTSPIEKVLIFNHPQRHFKVYFEGKYKLSLELTSDGSLWLP